MVILLPMKSFAIFTVLVLFVMFNPITTFGQHTPTNYILLETLPDSNQIAVTITGELQDDGFSKFVVEGYSGSDANTVVFEETYTFTKNNPTHVFDIDYPFLPGESYLAYGKNGWNSEAILWIPNPVTQEKLEKEKPSTQDTAESSNKQINELQFALTQKEITIEQDTSEDSLQSLLQENEFLKQEIEKKNAIIMEQLKVIRDLAAKITSAIFEEPIGKLYFIVDTSEVSIESLLQENEFLKQEIEKKNAIIMEQLKVIQDLAARVTSAIFEPRLNYFSLV